MNRAGAQMLRLPGGANPSLSGPDALTLPFRVFRDGRELTDDELPMQVAARQGEPVQGFQEELRFDDGEVKALMTYAAPLRDAAGKVYGCVGTFADVTAAKESERRYRETLERLKLHIDNTPVAALEWDDEARILRWSPAAERMFGWSEEEALGQSVEALGLVHEEDRARVAEVMDALVGKGVERNKSLNRNRCKGGDVIWCEWYNSVLRDEGGALVSVLFLAMDVTDRQALEASLRLQAERLAEADRRKNAFLSMLGHELRNPLAPVRTALSLMTMKADDPQTMGWAREVIDRQTQHLERLVDDLLDVARITRGAIRLQMEPLDVAAVVQEAIESTEAIVRERAHRVEVDLAHAPVTVNGDATRLVQVFANLINNAAKYTDRGGLIRVSLAPRDGAACVRVEDNGRGIAPEELPYIFDVFSQGQRHLVRADGGLGLGLTLVKQLTDMHGGTVQAQSTGAGHGSSFVVTLPICDAARAEADPGQEADSAPASAAADKKRVLLVDDNQDVLDSLKMVLKSLGHEVWDVSAGAQVVDAVQQVHPDVIILDIGLQDIDGIEVARRLAELPQRRAMKVVAFSGYGEGVAGAEPGLFDAHVLKGTSINQLKQALE